MRRGGRRRRGQTPRAPGSARPPARHRGGRTERPLLAVHLHRAVEDAAQPEGVPCEPVQRLDGLVGVRVWRVGDVVHCDPGGRHTRGVTRARYWLQRPGGKGGRQGPEVGAGPHFTAAEVHQTTRALRPRCSQAPRHAPLMDTSAMAGTNCVRSLASSAQDNTAWVQALSRGLHHPGRRAGSCAARQASQ